MRVFISHGYTDEPLAKKVATGLEKGGLQVWDAMREISPAENWDDKVKQALQESDAMVVLLTANALRSSWVRREIEYALGEQSYRQRVIPVLADDPEELHRHDIPWILKRFQMINMGDYSEEDEGINQIVKALLDKDSSNSSPKPTSIP